MKSWAWDKKNLPMAVTEPSLDLQSVVSAQDIINASITHGIRTAVAATVSVIISRFVQMPEAYWAAIATLIVIQSTLGATLTLSIGRIVATAVGASVGALEVITSKQICRVRRCNFSRRIAAHRVSFGEDRISLREHYSHHYRSNSALRCTVDNCLA
jgi:hypothetical protein